MTGPEQFDADLADLLSRELNWLAEFEPDEFSCKVVLNVSGTSKQVRLMLDEGYHQRYPEMAASVMIDDDYEELRPGRLIDTLGAVRRMVEQRSAFPATATEDTVYSADCDSDSCVGSPSSKNKELLADIQRYRELYGDTLSLSERIDETEITLQLSMDDVLDSGVCIAWGLLPLHRRVPLSIRVRVSSEHYLEVPTCSVYCYQEGTDKAGLAGQLTRILQTFVQDVLGGDEKTHPTAAPPAAPPAAAPAARPAAAAPAAPAADPRAAARLVTSADRKHTLALKELQSMGFDKTRASIALRLAGSLDGARRMLLECPEVLDDAAAAAKSPPPPPPPSAPQLPAHRRMQYPDSTGGFLVRIRKYALQRIPTASEHCVICDKMHVFASGAMLKLSVCSRDICTFAFQKLGVGADSAKQIATEAGVVDLLVAMAKSAACSTRWELIFDPYPTVFDPSDPDGQTKLLDPANKSIERVRKVFQSFPAIQELSQAPVDIKTRMEGADPCAHSLLTWIITSNRCQLIKLRGEDTVTSMRTPHQYLLLSAAPEKEHHFQELKAKHGTKYAFHGSSVENWHSILRNGLYSASNTKFQVNGAAHGAGIYLSPDASVSFGYSGMRALEPRRAGGTAQRGTDDYISVGNEMRCIAICEVVDHKILQHGNIWVQPNPECVVTRFLFVYDRRHSAGQQPSTQDKAFQQELNSVVRTHLGIGPAPAAPAAAAAVEKKAPAPEPSFKLRRRSGN